MKEFNRLLLKNKRKQTPYNRLSDIQFKTLSFSAERDWLSDYYWIGRKKVEEGKGWSTSSSFNLQHSDSVIGPHHLSTLFNQQTHAFNSHQQPNLFHFIRLLFCKLDKYFLLQFYLQILKEKNNYKVIFFFFFFFEGEILFFLNPTNCLFRMGQDSSFL